MKLLPAQSLIPVAIHGSHGQRPSTWGLGGDRLWPYDTLRVIYWGFSGISWESNGIHLLVMTEFAKWKITIYNRQLIYDSSLLLGNCSYIAMLCLVGEEIPEPALAKWAELGKLPNDCRGIFQPWSWLPEGNDGEQASQAGIDSGNLLHFANWNITRVVRKLMELTQCSSSIANYQFAEG